eukprot:COSAG06_NODE_14394_length_1160_cov_2.360038_1_plen_142_part_00
MDVVSRFVAIGDGGDDGNLQMLVHERRDVEGPQHAGEMCPPVVIMAPGVEGGLGPGLEAAAAGTEPAWGADCDPALLGSWDERIGKLRSIAAGAAAGPSGTAHRAWLGKRAAAAVTAGRRCRCPHPEDLSRAYRAETAQQP